MDDVTTQQNPAFAARALRASQFGSSGDFSGGLQIVDPNKVTVAYEWVPPDSTPIDNQPRYLRIKTGTPYPLPVADGEAWTVIGLGEMTKAELIALADAELGSNYEVDEIADGTIGSSFP